MVLHFQHTAESLREYHKAVMFLQEEEDLKPNEVYL